MRDANGLKTAVEKVMSSCDSVPGSDGAVQQSLLCEDEGCENAADKGVLAPRVGGGRPPGATNRSTKEWQKFLLSQFESPLVGLARISTASLKDLAKELGLKSDLTYDKALELIKLQVGCMNALAPYVHQKMPTAIDAGEGGLIQLVINHGHDGVKNVMDADAPALEIIDFEREQNQPLSDDEKQNLNAAPFNAPSDDVENIEQSDKKQTDYVSVGKDGIDAP